jgi:hypothetical protein
MCECCLTICLSRAHRFHERKGQLNRLRDLSVAWQLAQRTARKAPRCPLRNRNHDLPGSRGSVNPAVFAIWFKSVRSTLTFGLRSTRNPKTDLGEQLHPRTIACDPLQLFRGFRG